MSFWEETAVVFLGYLLLLITSGTVVKRFVPFDKEGEEADSSQGSDKEKIIRTGRIIGKSENILILTFILLEAYTALAIVFAAKAIVRKEDMERNSFYYLAGTMVNVTWSVVFSVAFKVMLSHL